VLEPVLRLVESSTSKGIDTVAQQHGLSRYSVGRYVAVRSDDDLPAVPTLMPTLCHYWHIDCH